MTEVFSAILFKLNGDANDRLDAIRKYLGSLDAAKLAMTLIQKIEDPDKRDDAIRELVQQLGVNPAAATA